MDFKEKIKDQGRKITWVASKLDISQPLLSMYLNGERKMPDHIKEKLKDILK